MHALLETCELWKMGDSSLNGFLEIATRRAYACFLYLGRVIGEDQRIPKLHDLLHVPKDVELWNSSICTSTGEFCSSYEFVAFLTNSYTFHTNSYTS